MTATFIDTSFLIALVRRKDALHERASALQANQKGPLLTTEFVLLEFLDALCSPPLRSVSMETVAVLRQAIAVRIEAATSELIAEGMRIFEQHSDKNWGLTDCISFHVMRREGLQEALTSDHHFEQAGFRALMR